MLICPVCQSDVAFIGLIGALNWFRCWTCKNVFNRKPHDWQTEEITYAGS